MKLRFHADITNIIPHVETRWLQGVGAEAQFEHKSVGYYIVLNHTIRIDCGDELPDCEIGQVATIILTTEPRR